jgi:two-component system OmpR family response regulator
MSHDVNVGCSTPVGAGRLRALASSFLLSRVKRNLSVLLVEDSRLLADRLREAILKVPGTQLAGAVDNEAEAVDILRRSPVDVVLLDINLRHGTGFGVLRSLTSGQHDKVIAIVLTNHDLGEYRRAAAELGARHFLDKLRDFDRLPTLLQEIGDRSGDFADRPRSVNA